MSSRKAALGFILVTLFLDILGIGLVVPVLPDLVKSFTNGDTSQSQHYVGEFSAAYALMQFLFSPLLGSLSDRFGRRPVLLLSMLGSSASYALLGWAPSLGWLLAGRVIAGVTGASLSAASAYIADVTPPEKRAQGFGLIGMMFGLGFIAGPAVGGYLGSMNLRYPFVLAGALALLNAVYGFFVLPESLSAEHRRPFSLARANPVGTFGALARNPTVLGLASSFFFANLAQRGLETVWMIHSEHRYGWTLRQASYSLVAVGVAAAVVQGGLVRRIIPVFGERKALNAGLVVAILSFLLYGLASQGWMIYAIIPLGAFAGLSGPATQGLVTRAVRPSEQGMLQGGLTSLRSVTDVVGPLVSSYLFGYFVGPTSRSNFPAAPFFLGTAFLVVALVLALKAEARADREPVPASVPPPAVRTSPGGAAFGLHAATLGPQLLAAAQAPVPQAPALAPQGNPAAALALALGVA